jgi:hypothetical protein
MFDTSWDTGDMHLIALPSCSSRAASAFDLSSSSSKRPSDPHSRLRLRSSRSASSPQSRTFRPFSVACLLACDLGRPPTLACRPWRRLQGPHRRGLLRLARLDHPISALEVKKSAYREKDVISALHTPLQDVDLIQRISLGTIAFL